MPAIQLPLLLGFVIMSLASLGIYATGSKNPEWRHHTHAHALVPFIAATAYLAMTLGTGILTIHGDETLFLARYADWSVTTPILLTGLTLTALHEHHRHSGYVVSIIVLDALMIVTGLLAAISTNPAVRWIWFLWSSAAFAGVLYMIWVPLRRWSETYGGRLNDIYKANATVPDGGVAALPGGVVPGTTGHPCLWNGDGRLGDPGARCDRKGNLRLDGGQPLQGPAGRSGRA